MFQTHAEQFWIFKFESSFENDFSKFFRNSEQIPITEIERKNSLKLLSTINDLET